VHELYYILFNQESQEVGMKILLNRAKCLNCGDIITSTHRYDWVSCSCFNDPTQPGCGIFVDGGNEYLRRGGNFEYMEDLSEYRED